MIYYIYHLYSFNNEFQEGLPESKVVEINEIIKKHMTHTRVYPVKNVRAMSSVIPH